MTTRHVSAENAYPFVPPVLVTAADGILDLYFVIQGEPTSYASSSSSSASGAPAASHADFLQVSLVSYVAGAGTTTYTFEALFNARIYEIVFVVPHTGGTGQVSNTDATAVSAVMIFNTDKIIKAGSSSVQLEVEPSRAQWHVEDIQSIEFLNIAREAGVEDPTTLIPVRSFSSSDDIEFEDGYNTEVGFDGGTELSFIGGLALGKGLAPGFGETTSSASSTSGSSESQSSISSGAIPPAQVDAVSTVNGFIPVSGRIAVTVSQSLAIQRSVGLLEILGRIPAED
jgi:hypothetical protein